MPPTTWHRDAVLPRPYLLLLCAELVCLAGLVIRTGGDAPLRRELGWIGAASMLLMHVYSLRRRLPALRGLGRLPAFLHFHIFAGLQGALFVSYHSIGLHRAKSLQALDIGLVAVVVCSGAFGRYVYGFLPRTLKGDRLTLRELEAEVARAEETLAQGGAQADPSVLSERLRLLRSRTASLAVAERIFRRWILFHRPLTLLLFAVTILHVVAHFIYRPF